MCKSHQRTGGAPWRPPPARVPRRRPSTRCTAPTTPRATSTPLRRRWRRCRRGPATSGGRCPTWTSWPSNRCKCRGKRQKGELVGDSNWANWRQSLQAARLASQRRLETQRAQEEQELFRQNPLHYLNPLRYPELRVGTLPRWITFDPKIPFFMLLAPFFPPKFLEFPRLFASELAVPVASSASAGSGQLCAVLLFPPPAVQQSQASAGPPDGRRRGGARLIGIMATK